ncbi:hypothetical protein D9M72_309480 [compost metagenome]
MSRRLPSRSMPSVTVWPGWLRTALISALACVSGLPCQATMRSPCFSPARSAAESGSTSVIVTGPPFRFRPSVASGSCSGLPPVLGRRGSVTSRSVPSAPRTRSTARVSPKPSANTAMRRSFQERTASVWPLAVSDSTRSPSRTPACAAMVPAAGAATTGTGSRMPPAKSAKYSTIASAKLASGPAATITKRLPTGWRLKARGRSAGSIGVSRSGSTSRSSSILT